MTSKLPSPPTPAEAVTEAYSDPIAHAIAQQYDRFQASLESLAKPQKYLNYGYTTASTQSAEDRQEALCLKVFSAARVEPTHRILDVGFGSGEQDFLWAGRSDFAELEGFNISSSQVDFANARALKEGHTDRLSFTLGRAEELPGVAPASIDRLLAVECAFYFDRPAFYRRAAEVLVPGGLLVAADISFNSAAAPLTWLRPDLARVGTLASNRRAWECDFDTIKIDAIHPQVIPGAELAVREIRRNLSNVKLTQEQREQWQSMAFWSRLVALGLRSRLLRYDLIVLKRRPASSATDS